MMKQPFFDNFEARSTKLAQRYLVATGADARRTVKASLKSGGKNRYSKTYKSSAPGEPPLTHGSRLKRSIRYDVENPALVKIGAPSIAGSKTAKVLEKGGQGKITETRTRDDYFERRKKNARKAASALRKQNAGQEVGDRRAPTPTKRPYTLVSESGATRRVTKYERFKSDQKAKRAEAAPDFQRWRDKVQKTKTTETTVKPRPFVKPGVEKETEEAKARARWARLVRTGALRK